MKTEPESVSVHMTGGVMVEMSVEEIVRLAVNAECEACALEVDGERADALHHGNANAAHFLEWAAKRIRARGAK